MSTPFRLEPLPQADLAWLEFERNGDDRGWLSEIYNQAEATRLGLPVFGQDNVSRTTSRGLVRGLHFQHPPHAQAKLFRVVSGRVFNVVVDLRPARFGAVHGFEIDADTPRWLHVPAGYAHGFQSLEDAVETHYKVSHPYTPAALGAIRFDDPELGIEWPIVCPEDHLSVRDRTAGTLTDARAAFLSPRPAN